MHLTDIAFQNLSHRKMRSALLVISVVIGVASIIFLYTTTQAMKKDVANKLDQYGSNILNPPRHWRTPNVWRDNSWSSDSGHTTGHVSYSADEND